MEKISVILLIASLLGVVVCLTLMFAGLYYGFDTQPWLNGFGLSAFGLLIAISLICHQLTKEG